MKELICIICPNSCVITKDEEGNISGYLCKRGLTFATQEFNAPKRSVTSTVKTIFKDHPVVAVKTDKEIDKALVMPLLAELKKVVVTEKLKIGEVVLSNALGTDVNIILTTDELRSEV